MTLTRTSLAALTVFTLAGCTTSHPDRIGAPAATTPPASAAPTAAPSPSTPPATPVATTHPFGESVPLADVAVATAYGYKQPVATGAPKPDQPGYEWGAVDVKVCAGTGAGDTKQGITVTHEPWALVYDDASIAQPSETGYQQFPQPEYPFGDRTLAWGRCVRGWITFPVPAGKRPVMVEYQPRAGSSVEGQTVDWAVK